MTGDCPPPMIAVDLHPDEPGAGYPCRCSPQWHCQPIIPAEGVSVRLREWHHPDCDWLEAWRMPWEGDVLDLLAGRPVE